MICKICGNELNENAKFCGKCGTTVTDTKIESVAAPVYQQQTSTYAMVTNRKLWKMVLFGIITLGIYPMIMQDKMIHELNIAAYHRDGKITLTPGSVAILFTITFFIYYFVWSHQYMARLQSELKSRQISYSCGPVHFWILGVLLGITLIAPLYLEHKVIKAHNLINENYNQNGQ